MSTAYLVAGVRTPFGRYGGALAAVRPDDLAAHAVGALTRRLPSVDWAAVDDVVLGCANQAGEDNRNVARMAALHVNPHGGAIALGHPLGASGARLALTAARELHDRGARRALATMCIGVGQGIALLLEAV